MNNLKSSIFGLCLIILGVIFGLNTLGITNINVFFSGWWTLFIIIPSFVGLFDKQEKTGNIIALFIGIILLLCAQDVIDFALVYDLILPFILIVIGLSFIFKGRINKKVLDKLNKTNVEKKEYCATFSEEKIDLEKEKFEGCSLTSVFGSIKLDLSESKIEDDVMINTTCIFGGIDLIVPEDVKVIVKPTSIFGGIDDKRKNKKVDSKITIYVNATNIFGGVDIK